MRTSEGLTRFLTFIDAIVAIAVTLLILPLVDIATEIGNSESVADLFHHHGAQLFSFLLSFFVIAWYWLAHHRIFERVKAYDAVIVWVTLLWALTIVFLPFPTQLAGKYGSNPGVAALYIGVLLVSSTCLAALSFYVARRPELHRENAEPRGADAFITTFLCAVAFVVVLIVPRLTYYPLLLLLLTSPIQRVWRLIERA